MSKLSYALERSVKLFQHYIDTYADDKLNERTESTTLTEDAFIMDTLYHLGVSVNEKYAGIQGALAFRRYLVERLSK